MELWPSCSPFAVSKKNQPKSDKRKSRPKQTRACYPIIDHGTQSAATLVKNDSELEWKSVHSVQKGSLITQGQQSKVFPCTRPKEIKSKGASLRQRAEHGANFLRRYHPDVDVPSELIEDVLKHDDESQRQHNSFNPFSGNTLSATYCFDGVKKRAIALAFPSGRLGCELNISPIVVKPDSLLFQPTIQPAWMFDTPIRQIASSAPAVYMEGKLGCNLAVRTYGQVSIFDIRNQTTSVSEPTTLPFATSEIMVIRSQELQNSEDGAIMDMDFSRVDRKKLFIVTEHGAGYQCSCVAGQQMIEKIFDTPQKGGGALWRILGDRNTYGGTVTSERLVHKFDTRDPDNLIDLFEYNDERNVITSICPTQVEHLLCVSTTSQVIWVDVRYARQPLLGWKHHRTFDRTLNLQTIEFGSTSLAFLCSSRNTHITSISVNKPQVGPLQCQIPLCALAPSSHSNPIIGRTLIRHPDTPSNSFSLLEMSAQGSLYEQGFLYAMDASTISPGRENAKGRFDCSWSDDVHELKRMEEDLTPEYGALAQKEMMKVDLSGLYEALFGREVRETRAEAEETNAEEVYEILEEMATYWQRSDAGEEHIRTLFDIALGTGEDPKHEERADFFTGTPLSSARGYRARKRNHLPVEEIAKKAAWYANIGPILHRISPDVFKNGGKEGQDREGDSPVGKRAGIDAIEAPYTVSREEENPEADRRETEAREELALDLVLASHVYSASPLPDPIGPPSSAHRGEEKREGAEEDTSFLTQETEKLSLYGRAKGKGRMKEPPQVTFEFLRPVDKEGYRIGNKRRTRTRGSDSEAGLEDETRSYPTTHQKDESADVDKDKGQPDADSSSALEEASVEDNSTPQMPLGVRLLLSEWNVGEDPFEYEYVDPYDLDPSTTLESSLYKSGSRRSRVQFENQSQGRGQMKGTQQQTSAREVVGDNGMERTMQSQVPPIITSRALKERELQAQPPTLATRHARTQTQTRTQTDLAEGDDLHPQPLASTQIEPGRFGGRPLGASMRKAKVVKKRVGGF